MARPLDPRLLREAAATRGYVVLTALLGGVTAALVVAQALLLARVVAGVAIGRAAPSTMTAPLLELAAVVAGRAATSWAQERFGHRAATAVVAQLRARLVAHVAALGPRALDGDRGPAIATLTTRGLDALDGYLVRYLPQLLLAATVTPAVLAVVWWQDTLSGVIIVVTLPLVPLFMVLVGLSTQAAADRRLRMMERLGGQVLDLVAGLPTLRALGRERGQAVRVRESGEAYRRATMRTLRQAFLSALVLETLTTISVALVAVGIGLRLVSSELDLRTGLAVLVLAPEVYLPLRMVGVHYHASVDGLAAVEEAFTVLDRPLPPHGTTPCPDLRGATIELRAVSVVHDGREVATPCAMDARIRPGRVLALVGASGTGKSTAVQVLLGLRRPDAGRVVVTAADAAPNDPGTPHDRGTPDRSGTPDDPGTPDGSGTDLATIDPSGWWDQIAWVPQQPLLVPGTLAENLRLVAPNASAQALDDAARAGGLAEVVAGLPQGWNSRIGQGGHGLSAGQRQRLAVARALLRRAALVVLDEPTAHLDAATERLVHDAVRRLRDGGSAVVLVAHRPALIALADDVVRVVAGPAPQAGPTAPTEPAAQDGRTPQPGTGPRTGTPRTPAGAR